MKDGPQRILLTLLNELNNPYRVSYEMVARALWPDPGPTKIQRSRTRDLSRQFRGEKAIEWRVVEVYVNLLFTSTDPARGTHLENLRQLHVQAFGATVDPDGQPTPEPEPPAIDPAYVADLRRQLEESRTRAAFATALLVIVQAENTALRGRGASFDWFGPAAATPGDDGAAAGGAAGGAAGHPNGSASRSTAGGTGAPGGGAGAGDRFTRRARPGPDGGGPHPLIDPATAPIVRRQGHRAGQRRRPGAPAGAGDTTVPGGKTPVYLSGAAQAPPSTLTALARSRSVTAALYRLPTPEQASDDLGLDILVGREKRRRGRSR
ncbi:hypothetical protein [Parafrankia discariae]|uniref:hypothetical protein n=1 Tax=Parafrankia discariae TaxID=365528 RepID=UPI001E631714|nr:hypothetical protein [Parafrankia discariae]